MRIIILSLSYFNSTNRLRFSIQPYTCEMELDAEACIKNNIHNRTTEDIYKACKEYKETPAHYVKIDYSYLLKPVEEVADTKTDGSSDKGQEKEVDAADKSNEAAIELIDSSGEVRTLFD